MRPDEGAVYSFCTELRTTRQVSDATFRSLVDKIGERAVVDLIGVMGCYNMVSMTLNTDRHPIPDGVAPELKPLR
jgi:4-carboxymuconolactone decarboxylase